MPERKFAPLTRRENTRDKRPVSTAIRFTPTEVHAHFVQNIRAVRAQTGVARDMLSRGNRAEAEFIWRTQILYLESALDFYMHELTTYGMLSMYTHLWPRTADYEKIEIAIGALDEVLDSPGSSDWLITYVRDAFGRDTLTSYARIKDQADLLGIDIRACVKAAFPEVGPKGNAVGYANDILSELANRRNRIAHQTDRNPDNALQTPITAAYVEQSVDRVERLVNALHRAALDLDRRA